MNNLSWMIYAADVADNASVLAILVALGAVAVICLWPVRNAWLNDFRDGEGVCPTPIGKLLTVAGVAAVLATIIPASSTIYAIAASEVGEDVLNSETTGKAMQALDAWLDRQIAGTEQEQDQ